MPDVHQGYGFPVGGVAATELPDGVVSPGGVGYDINCGVRLLGLPLPKASSAGGENRSFTRSPAAFQPVPASERPGSSRRGARPRAPRGPRALGASEDLERTESEGCLPGADPGAVSERARARRRPARDDGLGQPLRRAAASRARLRPRAAEAYGLREDQLTVLIHSGSRGLGHQVCTDYVKRMDAAMRRHGIELPDRQLACAPASSPEGGAYLAAMAAANFAWANRQTIADAVRAAVTRVLGRESAKGRAGLRRRAQRRQGRAHQGATCSFTARERRAPSRQGRRIPVYQDVGQPVFIPGSMGTSSFVLAGEPGLDQLAFGSTCHGAGRRLSRTGARKRVSGAERRELEARGIVVRSPSNKGLAEEAPLAYKDVERVVEVVERAGLSRRVAQLVPIGVVKG